MNKSRPFDFGAAFRSLTDHAPFPWQVGLFERLVRGNPPVACDIPTGLGKTSVVAIWLLALAANKAKLPPRLVYVVNRRTVVDQTTSEVERFRDNLLKKPELIDLKNVLGPVALSTLRGQFADNREWLADPSRAAVIVGTVDMIGSRLLFNGYRAGSWQLARHAGLIGHDAILVHDEAHLEPSFQKLIKWVEQRQRNDGSPRPLRVIAMSATSRAQDGQDAFTISDEDKKHPMVQQRYSRVRKELHLEDHNPVQQKLPDQLVELAYKHADNQVRVIVYVRRPEHAGSVRDSLLGRLESDPERENRVALLTGTIRGHERDLLLAHPAVRGLLQSHDADGQRITPSRTTWLVATSAGEVGADFDADHLVCDLAPMDAMIQRLGRVNRRGGQDRIARCDVVLDRPEKRSDKDGKEKDLSKLDQARLATTDLLEQLPSIRQEAQSIDVGHSPRDASPAALRDLVRDHREEYARASSPEPGQVTPHDVVLDAWALTSIHDDWPLAHDVHPYLRGMDEQTPETNVAWRAELDQLRSQDEVPSTDIVDMMRSVLRHYPLRQTELVREKPQRVADLLVALRERQPTAWVVLVGQRSLTAQRLGEFPNEAKQLAPQLNYKTVLLPPSLGGLNNAGMLELPSSKAETITSVRDVADLAPTSNENAVVVNRRRVLVTRNEESRWSSRILTAEPAPQKSPDSELSEPHFKWTIARDALVRSLGLQYVARTVLTTDDDGPARMLLLFRAHDDSPGSPKNGRVTIPVHNQTVENIAECMVQCLNLEETLRQVFRRAAGVHDLGKADPRWQKAIGNDDLDNPLAKSTSNGFNWRALDGYRHEFGSLREFIGEMSTLPDDESRDLVIHLVATHHGRGRPHFEPRAMADPRGLLDDLPELLQPPQVARRFARLQRRYGHWGLAWLESILMAADAEGSAAPAEAADEIEEDEE